MGCLCRNFDMLCDRQFQYAFVSCVKTHNVHRNKKCSVFHICLFSERYDFCDFDIGCSSVSTNFVKHRTRLGHPFFSRLASNAFPDIGSVGRIEKKKLKKNHKKSRNSGPWYPWTTLKVNIHIFGLTKCKIYCEKCSCFCFCFSLGCYYAHF